MPALLKTRFLLALARLLLLCIGRLLGDEADRSAMPPSTDPAARGARFRGDFSVAAFTRRAVSRSRSFATAQLARYRALRRERARRADAELSEVLQQVRAGWPALSRQLNVGAAEVEPVPPVSSMDSQTAPDWAAEVRARGQSVLRADANLVDPETSQAPRPSATDGISSDAEVANETRHHVHCTESRLPPDRSVRNRADDRVVGNDKTNVAADSPDRTGVRPRDDRSYRSTTYSMADQEPSEERDVAEPRESLSDSPTVRTPSRTAARSEQSTPARRPNLTRAVTREAVPESTPASWPELPEETRPYRDADGPDNWPSLPDDPDLNRAPTGSSRRTVERHAVLRREQRGEPWNA